MDTKTQLTDGGSAGSTIPTLVPGGKSFISSVLCAATSNYAAAGSASIFLRIEGPALMEGPEVVTIAAVGGTIFLK